MPGAGSCGPDRGMQIAGAAAHFFPFQCMAMKNFPPGPWRSLYPPGVTGPRPAREPFS